MYECGNTYTWATFTSDVTNFTQNGYPTAVSIRRGDVLDGFAKHIPCVLITMYVNPQSIHIWINGFGCSITFTYGGVVGEQHGGSGGGVTQYQLQDGEFFSGFQAANRYSFICGLQLFVTDASGSSFL